MIIKNNTNPQKQKYMEYLRYNVNVGSLKQGIIHFQGSEKGKDECFYPFERITFNFEEVRICPFCGKELKHSSYYCSCQEFKDAIQKLQESLMDKEHKLELHKPPFCVSHYEAYVSEIACTPLSEKEISELGPDFWDTATRSNSSFGNKKSYLLSNATFDGKKVTFYCKDIGTKKVWQCEWSHEFDNRHEAILFGEHYRKFVANPFGNPHAIGNYHEETGYDERIKFSNWNQLCKMLLTLWHSTKQMSRLIDETFLFFHF